MDAYDILKFLHVLLAIAAVGTNITYGFWLSRAGREPQYLGYALGGVKLLDDRLANPAYALLFVTGVGLIYVGKLPWTTPWLLTAMILYGIMLGLGLLGFTPLLRLQIAALKSRGPQSSEYRMFAARSQRLGILISVLVLVILFLMVTKPTLWG